jgi:transposase
MASSYPKAHGVLAQTQDAIAAAELSDLVRELFVDLLEELRALDLRLDKLDQQLLSLCRTNEACRRLSKLPGVGPVIATALVAAVDDGRHFRSGRELAAWIGLVPRQYTTGGKPRLGGIGRRANHYLRRQMIHGARAVMFRLTKHDDRRSQWLKGVSRCTKSLDWGGFSLSLQEIVRPERTRVSNLLQM